MLKLLSINLRLLALVLLTACSQPTPEQEVKQTIDEMIETIESGERNVILQKYAVIPEGQDITTRDFSENKADKLLDYLRHAKNSKASISEDKKTATFHVPTSHRELVFSKIDGRWKLNN